MKRLRQKTMHGDQTGCLSRCNAKRNNNLLRVELQQRRGGRGCAKDAGNTHHVPAASVFPSTDRLRHPVRHFKTEQVTSQQLASGKAAPFGEGQTGKRGRRAECVVEIERVRRVALNSVASRRGARL